MRHACEVRLSRVRLAAGLVLAVLAASPVAARYVGDVAVAVVLASFAAYAIPACIAVLLLAAALRTRAPAVVAALAILVQAVTFVPALLGSPTSATGASVTVLTANVRLGLASARDLVDEVRAAGVTVLAVQELTPAFADGLAAAGVRDLLPFQVLDPGGGASGTGIWSALPLTQLSAWTTTLGGTSASVQLNGQQIVLRNVHPFPPSASDVRLWAADYDELMGFARFAEERTVVLGDFNATVQHRRLTNLMAVGRWRDAAEVVGAGQVRTWGPSLTRPALIDLDHVLVPPGMLVARFEVLDLDGSDHRPVLARLVLR